MTTVLSEVHVEGLMKTTLNSVLYPKHKATKAHLADYIITAKAVNKLKVSLGHDPLHK